MSFSIIEELHEKKPTYNSLDDLVELHENTKSSSELITGHFSQTRGILQDHVLALQFQKENPDATREQIKKFIGITKSLKYGAYACNLPTIMSQPTTFPTNENLDDIIDNVVQVLKDFKLHRESYNDVTNCFSWIFHAFGCYWICTNNAFRFYLTVYRYPQEHRYSGQYAIELEQIDGIQNRYEFSSLYGLLRQHLDADLPRK